MTDTDTIVPVCPQALETMEGLNTSGSPKDVGVSPGWLPMEEPYHRYPKNGVQSRNRVHPITMPCPLGPGSLKPRTPPPRSDSAQSGPGEQEVLSGHRAGGPHSRWVMSLGRYPAACQGPDRAFDGHCEELRALGLPQACSWAGPQGFPALHTHPAGLARPLRVLVPG